MVFAIKKHVCSLNNLNGDVRAGDDVLSELSLGLMEASFHGHNLPVCFNSSHRTFTQTTANGKQHQYGQSQGRLKIEVPQILAQKFMQILAKRYTFHFFGAEVLTIKIKVKDSFFTVKRIAIP